MSVPDGTLVVYLCVKGVGFGVRAQEASALARAAERRANLVRYAIKTSCASVRALTKKVERKKSKLNYSTKNLVGAKIKIFTHQKQ